MRCEWANPPRCLQSVVATSLVDMIGDLLDQDCFQLKASANLMPGIWKSETYQIGIESSLKVIASLLQQFGLGFTILLEM